MSYKLQVKSYKSKRGFSLFIALVISAVLLLIAVSVTDLATKSSQFSSLNKESQYAIFAADAGIECALYWDNKTDAFSTDASHTTRTINCNGSSITTGSSIPGTTTLTAFIGGGGGITSDVIWVEDSPLPAGAVPGGDGGDTWTWVSAPTAPSGYFGSQAHQSNIASGEHQHFFSGATSKLSINAGESLIAYIYIDASNPPSQVMLQWNSDAQSWNHRAYWGSNSICWGGNCAESQANHSMGSLPLFNQWVRLSVPASSVGLEGQTLNGIAFTLYNGRATWDRVGKSLGSSGNPTSVFGFSLNSGSNPTNACAVVTVTKNVDGTTTIRSKGYNTCTASDPRRVERGIELQY